MNQTEILYEVRELSILKSVTLWSVNVVGLLANVVGFSLISQVKISLPAARLLLRHQFVCDAIGCTVAMAYWITFGLKIPPTLLMATAFSYLWSNYFVFWFTVVLSSTNLAMLSFDRYWAVVWFRSYRRNCKGYLISLIIIIWAYTIVFSAPPIIFSYYYGNPTTATSPKLRACMMAYQVIIFIFAYILPGVLICVIQVRIILLLRGKVHVRAEKSSTSDPLAQDSNGAIDPNVRTITLGIFIMIVTYIVSRTYVHFESLLATFGVIRIRILKLWQYDGILLFSINFSVNPLAVIFTSPACRQLLSRKTACIIEPIHRLCSKYVRKNVNSV
ncbi:unnamed protein product [Echinostoma caproni]|uniref:G_PROTEIN_RECEP_F1_2 domain-containing protein n=1 Tax=Echinostoma caproni TaxID=27848 RepID=A0A183AGJ5_9TREM|nr:unnamed protein product [Echinostoma caproni]